LKQRTFFYFTHLIAHSTLDFPGIPTKSAITGKLHMDATVTLQDEGLDVGSM